MVHYRPVVVGLYKILGMNGQAQVFLNLLAKISPESHAASSLPKFIGVLRLIDYFRRL
jgi:hypothetical protein